MVARVIPVEPFDLIVFGATGDLARRKILPALCRRFAEGQMPPEARVIGCGPFVNGVAMALRQIEQEGATNVALHPGDARDLLEVLPPGCLSRIVLNYPDPWPKTRHHRRRFVTPEHLIPLARASAPGAEFRIATDIPDYVRQALVQVPRAGFDLVARETRPWAGWQSTRYELKALREGRVPTYLTFRRGVA